MFEYLLNKNYRQENGLDPLEFIAVGEIDYPHMDQLPPKKFKEFAEESARLVMKWYKQLITAQLLTLDYLTLTGVTFVLLTDYAEYLNNEQPLKNKNLFPNFGYLFTDYSVYDCLYDNTINIQQESEIFVETVERLINDDRLWNCFPGLCKKIFEESCRIYIYSRMQDNNLQSIKRYLPNSKEDAEWLFGMYLNNVFSALLKYGYGYSMRQETKVTVSKTDKQEEHKKKAVEYKKQATAAKRANERLRDKVKALENKCVNLNNILLNQKRSSQEYESKLSAEIQALKKENQALNEKINNLETHILEDTSLNIPTYNSTDSLTIQAGNIPEFFEGERAGIIYESLKYAKSSAAKGSRREDILSDVLEHNQNLATLEPRKEGMKKLLVGYKRMTAIIKKGLTELGFKISKDGGHYKLRYFGSDKYEVAVSETPSCRRSGRNLISDINKLVY